MGKNLCCNGPTQELHWPKDEENLFVEFAVRESETDEFVTGPSCRLEHKKKPEFKCCGQYQGFIGPVPFGTYTPYLEPGKAYFDMTQSIMHNVEYLNGSQGDIVHRFNGQEISGVTTSIFNNGTFRQVESVTFGWMSKEEALAYLQSMVDGSVELCEFEFHIHPEQIQTPEEHGRCHLCAEPERQATNPLAKIGPSTTAAPWSTGY